MKLRRILAASTAAVIAAAAMSVVSFADAEVAFSNSVTVTSTGNWWDQTDLTMEQVFGDVDPEDVTKVVVTVDNAASVTWNNSAKEYQKVDAAAGDKVEITDFSIDEGDGFFFAMAVSSNDTSYKATFSWDVYAEVAAVEDPVENPIEDPVEDPIEDPVDEETPDVIAPAPDDTVDEPIADEPIADEPVVDEPIADEPAADEPAADGAVVDTDNTTDTGKDSVDTGVEGIAAAAGVVALAGAAVVASRKRK